jgi:tetratricopeptide (TPR) repeat protein
VTASPAAHAPTPAPKPRPRVHKVVVDYDTPRHKAAKAALAPQPEDEVALSKARAAYDSGNQSLFGGDPSAAIQSYEQSLAAYPGYAAGYRGLGLAYAQQGDKAKALHAFHTYLAMAPAAKDVALIQKRVSMLQH